MRPFSLSLFFYLFGLINVCVEDLWVSLALQQRWTLGALRE